MKPQPMPPSQHPVGSLSFKKEKNINPPPQLHNCNTGIFLHLTAELRDVALLAVERQRHDTGDVHLGTVDVQVEAELDTNSLDVLETLLVVGTGTADPDLNLVLVENRGDLAQSADDTLESGSDLDCVSLIVITREWSGVTYVGEVGNTTTNEQDLALGVCRGTKHKVEDSAGVLEGLGLGGSTRVFTVVGELAGETGRGDGVGVDDGSTTTGNESPDATSGVEDGQLQGGTGLSIHLRDESLLLAHLTAERSGELHWRASIDGDLVVLGGDGGQAQSSGAASDGPLDTALELSGLVKLGSQIEEVDLSRGGISVRDDDERIDLEVSELAVDVDSVEAGDEVNEDIVNTLRDLLQESSGNLVVGRVLAEVDGDEQLLGLRIDIADIDTTLVGEEDPVALR